MSSSISFHTPFQRKTACKYFSSPKPLLNGIFYPLVSQNPLPLKPSRPSYVFFPQPQGPTTKIFSSCSSHLGLAPATYIPAVEFVAVSSRSINGHHPRYIMILGLHQKSGMKTLIILKNKQTKTQRQEMHKFCCCFGKVSVLFLLKISTFWRNMVGRGCGSRNGTLTYVKS